MQAAIADPFALLGPHATHNGPVVRAFLPGARSVEMVETDGGARVPLSRAGNTALFSPALGAAASPKDYRLPSHWPTASSRKPKIPMPSVRSWAISTCICFPKARTGIWPSVCGAQPKPNVDGIEGVRFAVWAPNAQPRVGGRRFQQLGRTAPSDAAASSVGRMGGVRAAARAGAHYKYEIVGAGRAAVAAEGRSAGARRPSARRPPPPSSPQPWHYHWRDDEWMARRDARADSPTRPSPIYEVHAGVLAAARRRAGRNYDWQTLAEQLIPYVTELGFTHIELLPIMEHPFGGSWGYQPLSQFAPSARYGTPEDFAAFVDACHRAGIGVILDWVPAHFPTDAMASPSSTAPRFTNMPIRAKAFTSDWNTLIYNLGRRRCTGFLIASALWWLETLPCRRAARRCRGLDALSRLFARGRASGFPTATAGARISKRSISCAISTTLVRRALSRRRSPSPRNPRPGPASPRPSSTAALAFPTNGTWGGCTTPCTISSKTRCIAAGNTTS